MVLEFVHDTVVPVGFMALQRSGNPSVVPGRSRKRGSNSTITWLRADNHPSRLGAINSVGKELGRGQIRKYLNCDQARVETQSAGVARKQVLSRTVKVMLERIEIDLLRKSLLRLMPQLHELGIGVTCGLINETNRPGGAAACQQDYQQEQDSSGRRLFHARSPGSGFTQNRSA